MVKGDRHLGFFLLFAAWLGFGHMSNDLSVLGHNDGPGIVAEVLRDLCHDLVALLCFFRIDAFRELCRKNAAGRDLGSVAGGSSGFSGRSGGGGCLTCRRLLRFCRWLLLFWRGVPTGL